MPKVSAAYRDARREQILDAAELCFARDGFHAMTMQDLVRESGLSPGAIYRYFTGKAEIIEAIAEARHQREAAALDALDDDQPLVETLAALAAAFVGPLSRKEARRERRVGIQVWAEALRDPQMLRLVRRGLTGPLTRLTSLLCAAQSRQELPSGVDAKMLARCTIALFHGLILQQAWDPSVDLTACLDGVGFPQLLAFSTKPPPARSTNA